MISLALRHGLKELKVARMRIGSCRSCPRVDGRVLVLASVAGKRHKSAQCHLYIRSEGGDGGYRVILEEHATDRTGRGETTGMLAMRLA